MIDEKTYWLALNSVKWIGAVRFRALLDAFGSAEAAWMATPAQWRQAGLNDATIEAFVQKRETIDLQQIVTDLEKHHITALTWEDETYPRKLRELDQAPPVLYVRGELLPEDEWAVAVVGTRRVTAYGQQVAEEFGAFLARNGITVVSGLAKGVDAISHQAALKAGGRTVAVLAHGLDQIYPAENRRLAEEIMTHGALVGDYATGTPPDAANFPPRNRIISGLSLAVVIIEAGEQSGALITAGFAAEQGREVFAVPGTIFAPQSKGTNMLIQRGAHPLVRFEDLLDLLNLEMMAEHKTATAVLPADATEAKLFSLLGPEPLHVNEIGALAQMPIDQVSSTLALMELKGLARQVGGMSYVAAREVRAEYRNGAEAPVKEA
ncbi:MAG: DNA-processing protein DprA [Anaerolineales bacterium]